LRNRDIVYCGYQVLVFHVEGFKMLYVHVSQAHVRIGRTSALCLF